MNDPTRPSATRGRTDIRVFGNSQLGGVSEMVDGVQTGAIQMAHHDFASLTKHIALISTLDPRGMDAFRKASASLQFVDPGHDHEGLGELIGCTLAVMQAEHERDGQKAH